MRNELGGLALYRCQTWGDERQCDNHARKQVFMNIGEPIHMKIFHFVPLCLCSLGCGDYKEMRMPDTSSPTVCGSRQTCFGRNAQEIDAL
jgi:hypothetical protein